MNTSSTRDSLRRSLRLAPAALLLAACSAPPQEARLEAPAQDLGIGFDRLAVTDTLGREIVFYASSDRDPGLSKPLVVWIQGSGGGSHFVRMSDGRVASTLLGLVARTAGEGAVVVGVEKPGVGFLDQPERPGTAHGTSRAFREEHTLPRWTVAVGAALEAARRLPGVDGSRVLVAGHSEGSIVAAHVAALLPSVTHVVVLSGGGPSQLFEMGESARRASGGAEPPEQREMRVEGVFETWERIMAQPDEVDELIWGHPPRRWASFLSSAPLDGLLATAARIYVAYGTEDTNSPSVSNDVLRAELVRRGRDVTVERRIGEDHGFRKLAELENDPAAPSHLPEVLGNVLDWYLADAP